MAKRGAATAGGTLFTIGHSTRSVDELGGILQEFGVERLVDVRTVPRSGHNPQFDRDVLDMSLRDLSIEYVHARELGGLRHAKKDSINTGWRNASFRGYADYMLTDQFAEALANLETWSQERLTVIMCAEAVPWRCHRSLIADAMVTRGWEVRHIMSGTVANAHKLTPFLKVTAHGLIYPASIDAR